MYDKIVCAELPNPDILPKLYKAVTTHMLHGPCGHINPQCVCMDKDTKKCSNEFPKSFCDFTNDDNDSFPTYRRRAQKRENIFL